MLGNYRVASRVVLSSTELVSRFFDHPPYSPHLALSDYLLFIYLMDWLESQHFSNNKIMEGVKTWLSKQAAEFFDTGIQEFLPNTSASIPTETPLRISLNM
jgi:hypothetical protein